MHSSSSGPCYSYSFCRNNNNKRGNGVRVVVVNGETISSLLLVLHSSTDMNQFWSPLYLKDLPPKKEKNIFNTRMKIFTVPIKLYFLQEDIQESHRSSFNVTFIPKSLPSRYKTSGNIWHTLVSTNKTLKTIIRCLKICLLIPAMTNIPK